ncbi:acyl-CoA dehydrogenase family protein [Pseudonocardia benzenivorans]
MAESTTTPTTTAPVATDVPVEFDVTDEQRELRAAVRRFCAEQSDEAAVRRHMESEAGYDPAVWARLGGELGVLGLAVPEELGGAGAGLVEQAIVVEELGAALLCGPVLGTIGLALPALVAATPGRCATSSSRHWSTAPAPPRSPPPSTPGCSTGTRSPSVPSTRATAGSSPAW